MLGILGETKHLFNEFYDSFSVDSKFQSPYPKRAYLNELDTPPIQLTILVKSFADIVLVFLLCPPPPKTAKCVGYQTLGTCIQKTRSRLLSVLPLMFLVLSLVSQLYSFLKMGLESV